MAREHRSFSVLFALGFVLRVVTMATYWPGVQFPDSSSYLDNAVHPGVRAWHPAGYPLFLSLFAWTHQVAAVTLVQHVLGLLAGALIYLLLRRHGCSKGWAAAGASTALLDPMQIYLEQYVLSDVLFMFLVLVVIAAAVLRPPTARMAVLVGLLVAYATTVRTIAIVLALPVAVYWLWRRTAWQRVAVAAVTAAVPLLGYAAAFDASHGAFALQGYSGRWLYGRVAAIANCADDHVPAETRPLCPHTAESTRVLPSEWVWNPRSPYMDPSLPANDIERSQLAGRFARAVIEHEPLSYLRVVFRDVTYAFVPSREAGTQGWFTGSWRFFQPRQPPMWRTTPMLTGFWGRPVHGIVLRRPAKLLHLYERFIYTPGPLAACAAGLGVIASVLRRRTGPGKVCALLAASGLLLLVVPIATVDLDYRYVLSAQELFLPAGALGASMLSPAVARFARGHRFFGRRRARAVTAGALLAFAVANGTSAEAYPGGMPAPVPLSAGATGRLPRLAVTVSAPEVVGYGCVLHTVEWRYRFRVIARWVRGKRLFVAADNFWVPANDPLLGLNASRNTARMPGLLSPYLLSRSHREIQGEFDVVLPSTSATLMYTDPLGAGALAWNFRAPAAAYSYPTPGSYCLTTLPGLA